MKGLTIGQSASTTRTFAPEDVAAYRQLTGDSGLHFGAEAATAVPGPCCRHDFRPARRGCRDEARTG
ncbi:MAG: hypothetical protein IPM76_20805 [Chloroflexi bacterium]|nr:hypothetical protein [Chloroflexota bacterium]